MLNFIGNKPQVKYLYKNVRICVVLTANRPNSRMLKHVLKHTKLHRWQINCREEILWQIIADKLFI